MGTPLPKMGAAPLSQFSTHYYCGQTAGCIKMPLGMEAGLSPGDCVTWGTSPLPQKGWNPLPNFGPMFPCLLWPNGYMYQDATWYGGRRPRCVRWGPSSPPQKGGGALFPIFGHVYCGQRAGWITMALGTEVGLGPGHIVLEGDRAPSPKRATPRV